MPIELSIQVYRCLLRVCPHDFHQRFAEEMLNVFEDLLRDEAADHSPFGVVPLSCSAYSELIRVAVRLRLREMPLAAAGLSCMISSALFLAFFRAVS
jgi:hypothetical protein